MSLSEVSSGRANVHLQNKHWGQMSSSKVSSGGKCPGCIAGVQVAGGGGGANVH